MYRAAIYIVVLIIALLSVLYVLLSTAGNGSTITIQSELLICIVISALGGATYCIRGIYIAVAVRRSWDPTWEIWYYLRPIASALTGLLAFIFVHAGLIAFEAKQSTQTTNFALYAISFIAGLNVDRFLSRVEEISHSLWGIKPSRASEADKREPH